jgi:hypothetical protein
VGIENMNIIQSLRVYPNPVATDLQIEYTVDKSKHIRIFITDLSGRKLISLYNQTESVGAKSKSFDISVLSSGVYLLVISDGDSQDVKKILVNR